MKKSVNYSCARGSVFTRAGTKQDMAPCRKPHSSSIITLRVGTDVIVFIKKHTHFALKHSLFQHVVSMQNPAGEDTAAHHRDMNPA